MAPKSNKSPRKSAPVRQVVKPVAFLDDDQITRALEAALSASTAEPSVGASEPAITKRRPSSATLSGSDSSRSALPVISRGKKRNERPSPGIDGPDSILAILDAAAPFDTPSKPKRVRTMTEKARLMQQDAQEDRRPSKVTRVASSNVGVSVKQEKVEDVTKPSLKPSPRAPPVPIEISDDDDLPPATSIMASTPVAKGRAKGKGRAVKAFETPPSSDFGVEEDPDITPRPPKHFAKPSSVVDVFGTDSSHADWDDEEQDDDVEIEVGNLEVTEDGDEAEYGDKGEEDGQASDTDDAVSAWSASPPLAPHPVLEGDGDEDPTSIMLVSSQDPEMAKFYLGLPKIDSFADVTPFGTDALDGLETVRASVVATGKKMLASDFKNLILGLMFARHGIFVNFSRVDPTLLEADAYSRIKFRDSETFCHGLMSGVVSASAIISPFQVTGHLGKYNQHRITLVPFGQEMRRDTSVWGQVLNFTVILATTSKTGFSFVTRGDNQPPSKFAAAYGPSITPTTPTKASSSGFKSVRSPAAPKPSHGVKAMTAYRDYDDRIPVFDGRSSTRPFTFAAADFDALPTWPLYKLGRAELPIGSVVTVGYTVGSYKGSSAKYLSTNALFVILLSVPEKVVA